MMYAEKLMKASLIYYNNYKINKTRTKKDQHIKSVQDSPWRLIMGRIYENVVKEFWQKAALQGADFSRRGKFNVTLARREPTSACSTYWRLNDPFGSAFGWTRQPPKIASSPWGILTPCNTRVLGQAPESSSHWSWCSICQEEHKSLRVSPLPPQQHLDQVNRFCRAHENDQHTQTHTDRPCYSVRSIL